MLDAPPFTNPTQPTRPELSPAQCKLTNGPDPTRNSFLPSDCAVLNPNNHVGFFNLSFPLTSQQQHHHEKTISESHTTATTPIAPPPGDHGHRNRPIVPPLRSRVQSLSCFRLQPQPTQSPPHRSYPSLCTAAFSSTTHACTVPRALL